MAYIKEKDLPPHLRERIRSQEAATKPKQKRNAKPRTNTTQKPDKKKVAPRVKVHPPFLKKALREDYLALINAKIKEARTPHEEALAYLLDHPDDYFGKQEHYLQVCLFHELWKQHKEVYELAYSVPNGGYRPDSTGGSMLREGQKTGVPDIAIDIPIKTKHGLRIELKREEGGTASANQKMWLARLDFFGYHAVLCTGWEEAWGEICQYIAEIYQCYSKDTLKKLIDETKKAA